MSRTVALAPPGAGVRRFEAALVACELAAVGERRRLSRLVEALCAAGMELVFAGASVAGLDGRLRARPSGPGRLFLCAGDAAYLAGRDGLVLVHDGPGDGLRFVRAELRRRGIGSGQVLAAREARSLVPLLEEQLRLRGAGALPTLDPDPAWTIAVEGADPRLERARAALLTLADGRIGTSGSPLAGDAGARPRVLAAGVYRGRGPETDLLPGPLWHRLAAAGPPEGSLRRLLDLRTGVLRQELTTPEGPLEAVLFSSLARPGTAALRAEGPPALVAGGAPLVPPEGADELERGERDGRAWLRVGGSPQLAAAASERRSRPGALDRLAAYAGDADAALARLREAEEAGFERLLAEQRDAWAERWANAGVAIEGDPELQLAVRFSLFHLIGSVAGEGEAALGARGLSGPAYRGHVFWDADVFCLPFFAATHPPAARALLEYRVRRLPAAREQARRLRRAGARFPWESAGDGFDVTPPSARDLEGKLVPIRTGRLEEHVTADVAWAAAHYLDWTGDRAFAAGPGRELILETARYWASRIRLDRGGRGHLYGVVGPDEYHEPVDDSAYTNVMARWNLRRAAALPGVDAGERRRLLALAEALVDGYDPQTGVYEEFAGFFGLEPVVIAEVAPRRPVAADLLLGRERVRAAQVVKQADVLMLHQLVPEEAAPGSLAPNLAFYEPRTAHGSSLSPAVHAALLARTGRLEQAVEYLRLAARIDLDDPTETTAGGLHLATMGGVWQALAYGFAGVRPAGEALRVDPRLPAGWSALELPVRFRGVRVRLRVEPGVLKLWAEAPVRVELAGEPSPFEVGPGWKEVGR